MIAAAVQPLTEVEQVRYHELTDLLDGLYSNVRPALMRAALHGQPVAVVVAVHDEDADGIRVDPVAVMVDPDLLRLLDPGDDVGIGGQS